MNEQAEDSQKKGRTSGQVWGWLEGQVCVDRWVDEQGDRLTDRISK